MLLVVVIRGRKHNFSIIIVPVIGQCGACCPCVIKLRAYQPVRTSPISIFIAFLNKYRQSDVVCITIYLKLLIIDRETNHQNSTHSNVGLLPWGRVKPGSNADDVPLLLLYSFILIANKITFNESHHTLIFWTIDSLGVLNNNKSRSWLSREN